MYIRQDFAVPSHYRLDRDSVGACLAWVQEVLVIAVLNQFFLTNVDFLSMSIPPTIGCVRLLAGGEDSREGE